MRADGILTPHWILVNDGQPPYSRIRGRSDNSERKRDQVMSPRQHMMIERKTISIMKACELVGVSRRTIYNWIASGKVEYVRTAGGSVRIFVDTLWREPGKVPDLTRKEAS